MFYMRAELRRFCFRAVVCTMTVLLVGLWAHLWARYILSLEASARSQAPPAAEAVSRGVRRIEARATAEEESGASLPGFFRWLIGYDPSDPISVVAYTIPAAVEIARIEIKEATATTGENGDKEVIPRPTISPGGMPSIEISGQGPQVLIYHTHTQESYRKTEEQVYAELPNVRTANQQYNIVRVGRELADMLTRRYGIVTLHDTTDHEPPTTGTAYIRSCATVERYLDQYDSLKILIDMHRDDYNARSWTPSTVTIDGQEVSRIMVIIGTGEGSTGNGYAVRPDWKRNLVVAQSLVDALNDICPGLALPVNIKTGRYNQHLSTGAILIEMGHIENTLDQALLSARYLAQALAQIMGKELD